MSRGFPCHVVNRTYALGVEAGDWMMDVVLCCVQYGGSDWTSAGVHRRHDQRTTLSAVHAHDQTHESHARNCLWSLRRHRAQVCITSFFVSLSLSLSLSLTLCVCRCYSLLAFFWTPLFTNNMQCMHFPRLLVNCFRSRWYPLIYSFFLFFINLNIDFVGIMTYNVLMGALNCHSLTHLTFS